MTLAISNLSEDYRVGGSVPLSSSRYVERQADKDLAGAIESAEFAYVLNSRQMGKSSLIAHTLAGLDPAQFNGTIIDLNLVASVNASEYQWYWGLASEIAHGLKIGAVDEDEWWRVRAGGNGVHLFKEFLEDVVLKHENRRIVIFVDEIDRILGQKNVDSDGFFTLIRSFYNNRAQTPDLSRLSFVIVGVAAPNDLIRDVRTTPFNIGTPIRLYGFTEQEAQPVLADGLRPYADSAQAVLREILSWTGGQPFLTQKLCHLVVEAQPSIRTGAEHEAVADLVRTQVIDNWEQHDDPIHLRDMRKRILHSPNNRTVRMLAMYRDLLQGASVPSDGSPEQLELRLTGMVTERDSSLEVFNKIYTAIFDEAWVTRELARLRPYALTLERWLSTGDEQYLLGGDDLKFAQELGRQQELAPDDYRYIAASLERRADEADSARMAVEEAKVEAERQLETVSANARRIKVVAYLTTAIIIAIAIATSIASVAFSRIVVAKARADVQQAVSAREDAIVDWQDAQANLLSTRADLLATQAELQPAKARLQDDRAELHAFHEFLQNDPRYQADNASNQVLQLFLNAVANALSNQHKPGANSQ